MSPVVFGILTGVAFGLVSVATMIPLEFADKTSAMLGAFVNRFAIGLVIPNLRLPIPNVALGAGVGLLLSLPDAIITKQYGPILVIGLLGGALIGWLSGRVVA